MYKKLDTCLRSILSREISSLEAVRNRREGGGEDGLKWLESGGAHNIQHRGTVNIVMHHSRLAEPPFEEASRAAEWLPRALLNEPFPPPPSSSFHLPPLILSRQGASRHLTRDLFARGGNGRGDKIPWREL